MVALSGRDTWLATFFSTALGALWLVFLVLKKDYEKLGEVMGRPAGKLAGLVLLLFFIQAGVVMIFDFMSFLTIILPQTPTVMFSAILIAMCAYSLLKGFEVVARVSTVLLFFCLALVAAGLLSGVSKIEAEKLLPVLGQGFQPVVRGAIFQFSTVGDLLALILLPYRLGDREGKRNVLLALLLIYLLIFILANELITVYGVSQINRTIYKFFAIFQITTIQGFFRIESFFIPLWFGTFLIKISVLFYAAVRLMHLITGLRSHHPLVLPTGVILVALTHLSFNNYIEYINFYVRTFNYEAILIQLTVPVFLLWLMKKAGSPGATGR